MFKAEPDSSSDVECLPNGLTKKKPGRDDVSHEKPEKLRKKAKSQLNQDILSIFEEHKQESSSNKNAFSESMLDDINSKKNKKSKNTSKSEIGN